MIKVMKEIRADIKYGRVGATESARNPPIGGITAHPRAVTPLNIPRMDAEV